jgi:hypothetical protein
LKVEEDMTGYGGRGEYFEWNETTEKIMRNEEWVFPNRKQRGK